VIIAWQYGRAVRPAARQRAPDSVPPLYGNGAVLSIAHWDDVIAWLPFGFVERVERRWVCPDDRQRQKSFPEGIINADNGKTAVHRQGRFNAPKLSPSKSSLLETQGGEKSANSSESLRALRILGCDGENDLVIGRVDEEPAGQVTMLGAQFVCQRADRIKTNTFGIPIGIDPVNRAKTLFLQVNDFAHADTQNMAASYNDNNIIISYKLAYPTDGAGSRLHRQSNARSKSNADSDLTPHELK
jgi:hypothetical protein